MERIKQLIWPLIMVLYGIAIFLLMATGELNAYIHPKLHILSFLAMVILFILAIATAKNNINKGYFPRLKGTYVVFIIPLLLFFIGGDTDASRQIAVENGIKISALPTPQQLEGEEESLALKLEAPDTESPLEINLEEEVDDATLYLTNVNFTALMDDMHANLSDYKGRKISYLGLVYKQKDFEDTEIVVGRLLMYCCAADAQVMGLLGHSNQALDYEDGDWVTIDGYIDEKAYKDPYTEYESSIPYLIIETISPAEEPEDPYVYFNE